jgi:hypothetical protein
MAFFFKTHGPTLRAPSKAESVILEIDEVIIDASLSISTSSIIEKYHQLNPEINLGNCIVPPQ